MLAFPTLAPDSVESATPPGKPTLSLLSLLWPGLPQHTAHPPSPHSAVLLLLKFQEPQQHLRKTERSGNVPIHRGGHTSIKSEKALAWAHPWGLEVTLEVRGVEEGRDRVLGCELGRLTHLERL